MNFIDGTKVTPEYLAAVGKLVTFACAAEENFTLDELEEYAESYKEYLDDQEKGLGNEKARHGVAPGRAGSV